MKGIVLQDASLELASFVEVDFTGTSFAGVNLDRTTFDIAYLSSLSADACAVADHPALRDKPEVVRAWRTHSPSGDWRGMRGFTRCPSVPEP